MDMFVSPAFLVDRMAQMRKGAVEQQVQIQVLKEVMQTLASAATALRNAEPSTLPLADGGPLGTQVNALAKPRQALNQAAVLAALHGS
jgi:hypothetical protein